MARKRIKKEENIIEYIDDDLPQSTPNNETTEQNLFDQDEAIKLIEYWIKQNEWKETGNDELNAYYNGIAAGAKFALMVLKRTGD